MYLPWYTDYRCMICAHILEEEKGWLASQYLYRILYPIASLIHINRSFPANNTLSVFHYGVYF